MMGVRALVMTLALGCALGAPACAWRATRADYGAYRVFRLAQDEHQRAVAGADYLHAFPEGVYADEVRAALGAAEERFYAGRASSARGLVDYLTIYPTGRYADRARAELDVLARREAESTADRERARAASEEAAAEALRAHRAFTRDRLVEFLGVLLRVRAWEQPMEVVVREHPALDVAFRAEPRPRCDASRCVKTLHVSFALPLPDGSIAPRASELRVVLRLADERLLGAEVWLPGYGFSRWYELETRSAVDDADVEARRAAIAWALAQVAPLLEEALGETFESGVRGPLPSTEQHTPLLALDAAGLSVDVVVAEPEGAGLDGFVIGPRAAP
ncbi:MAG: hypothetical protein R3B40_01685 [Polyangiales bacterium]|nr:hypothetical protein [Myxococcales bacterium]MCB9658847.1 hypothetical protein [Sandaracinaceae bacterium]